MNTIDDDVKLELEYEQDGYIEARAYNICNMGVGCTAGQCFAEAVVAIEMCGRKDRLRAIQESYENNIKY